MRSSHTWVVVLAAGEGTRLRTLTTNNSGDAIPKQYCSLRGGNTLLDDTLARAASVARADHICVIVAAQHRQWWQPLLKDWAAPNIIVQPLNRGTGVGLLLPLLHIMSRDSEARIIVLPSDHYVREEAILAAALRRAVGRLDKSIENILMLGFRPEDADPDLGYIVPGRFDAAGLLRVQQFVEKPGHPQAQQLIAAGALWNAFILAAHARTLLHLFSTRERDMVVNMWSAISRDGASTENGRAIQRLYRHLPTLDFSSHFLSGAEANLRVFDVERCGWNDLGTPARLGLTLRSLPRIREKSIAGSMAVGSPHALINLSLQYARLEGRSP
jgi:mannose-1-phosphate guanylyltransferase